MWIRKYILYGLLLSSMATYSQVPCLLYGRVYNSDGTIPSDGDIRITTYNMTQDYAIDTMYNGGYEHTFWSCNLSKTYTIWFHFGDTIRIQMGNINSESPYFGEYFELEHICPLSWEDLPAAVEIGTSVVSVELLSLKAEAEKNDVTVTWSTRHSDCLRFIVERRKGDASFEVAGQVPGQPDKQSGLYSYQDRNLDTGSYNYRLRFINADGSSTCSYEVNTVVNIPKSFHLCQNYPNPFNASTCIEYELPKPTEVHLQIFNTLGQRVYEIKKDHADPGYYEFFWYGESSNHQALSSGSYIIQMRAERYRSVKKMLLLK